MEGKWSSLIPRYSEYCGQQNGWTASVILSSPPNLFPSLSLPPSFSLDCYRIHCILFVHFHPLVLDKRFHTCMFNCIVCWTPCQGRHLSAVQQARPTGPPCVEHVPPSHRQCQCKRVMTELLAPPVSTGAQWCG